MVYKIQNFILEINITFLRLAFGIDIIDHEIDFIDYFFSSRHHRISNFTDICDFMNHWIGIIDHRIYFVDHDITFVVHGIS